MFRCKPGCNAECCGNVPIPKQVLKEFRDRIQRKFERVKLDGGMIYPVTKDGRCIFLNSKMRCEVYASRPKVCRLYGIIAELQCPYLDVNGRERTGDEVIRMRHYINDFVDVHLHSYLLNFGENTPSKFEKLRE